MRRRQRRRRSERCPRVAGSEAKEAKKPWELIPDARDLKKGDVNHQ